MLHRPKLIATLICVGKHSYLESNVIGTSCLLCKTKAIAFLIGHMASQNMSLCLGLQYQMWMDSLLWVKHCPVSLIVFYDLVSPLCIMHPRGQWGKSQGLLSSSWGFQELCIQPGTFIPMVTLDLPSSKVRGPPPLCRFLIHRMLESNPLHLKSYKERKIHAKSHQLHHLDTDGHESWISHTLRAHCWPFYKTEAMYF